jgi:hypothetical protein
MWSCQFMGEVSVASFIPLRLEALRGVAPHPPTVADVLMFVGNNVRQQGSKMTRNNAMWNDLFENRLSIPSS